MNSQRQKIPILWREEAKLEGLTIRHIGANHYAASFSLQSKKTFHTALLAKFSNVFMGQLSVSRSQSAESTTGPKLVSAMIFSSFLIENCRVSKINTHHGHRKKPICQNSKNSTVQLIQP